MSIYAHFAKFADKYADGTSSNVIGGVDKFKTNNVPTVEYVQIQFYDCT